eukprot:6455157-Amphidinium_carterae.1
MRHNLFVRIARFLHERTHEELRHGLCGSMRFVHEFRDDGNLASGATSARFPLVDGVSLCTLLNNSGQLLRFEKIVGGSTRIDYAYQRGLPKSLQLLLSLHKPALIISG